MTLNIKVNDRSSETGIKLISVKCLKTFRVYGERFYIHHKYDDDDKFITTHEIGRALHSSVTGSVKSTYNKTRRILYKMGKRKLLDNVKKSKEQDHKLITNKLKGKL